MNHKGPALPAPAHNVLANPLRTAVADIAGHARMAANADALRAANDAVFSRLRSAYRIQDAPRKQRNTALASHALPDTGNGSIGIAAHQGIQFKQNSTWRNTR